MLRRCFEESSKGIRRVFEELLVFQAIANEKLPDEEGSVRGTGRALAAGDDLYNLQSVAGAKLPLGEFGRRNRLAVMLDHDTAWQEILRDQERFD